MFTESAASQIPYNISYIVFLVFLAGTFGLKGLMVASVLAVASQITVQVPGMKKTGYKYKFILDFKDEYIKKIARLTPPIFVSVSVYQVNVIIDRSLASTLVPGSISALNYANTINGIVGSIFIAAIVTVIFPMLAEEVAKKNFEGLKKMMVAGINVILLITVPAAVGIIILAHPIVKLAFQRGIFDAAATYMTAGGLIFYTLGLVGSSVSTLLYNVYYSFQDTKTPMRVGFISVAVNIAFNLILIRPMAHRGLALATSISAIVSAMVLLYMLRKKLGPFGFYKSFKCGVKSATAAAVMGVTVYFLYGWLIGALAVTTLSQALALLVTVCAGAGLYLAIVYILKVEELTWMVGLVKERLGRKG
jgi:putative peptidoglycan lipid II flippase